MWRVWYLKHRVREILENKDGVGVVEIILILVGILTPLLEDGYKVYRVRIYG